MSGIALTSRNSRPRINVRLVLELSISFRAFQVQPTCLILSRSSCKEEAVKLRRIHLRLLGYMLLLMGMGSAAFGTAVAAPEISPASASSALALVSGVLLVMRGRRK